MNSLSLTLIFALSCVVLVFLAPALARELAAKKSAAPLTEYYIEIDEYLKKNVANDDVDANMEKVVEYWEQLEKDRSKCKKTSTCELTDALSKLQFLRHTDNSELPDSDICTVGNFEEVMTNDKVIDGSIIAKDVESRVARIVNHFATKFINLCHARLYYFFYDALDPEAVKWIAEKGLDDQKTVNKVMIKSCANSYFRIIKERRDMKESDISKIDLSTVTKYAPKPCIELQESLGVYEYEDQLDLYLYEISRRESGCGSESGCLGEKAKRMWKGLLEKKKKPQRAPIYREEPTRPRPARVSSLPMRYPGLFMPARVPASQLSPDAYMNPMFG